MAIQQIPIGRRGVVLVAVTFALIILADVFFYGQPVGFTPAAFLIALMAAICLRHGRLASSGPGWLLVVWLVALAVTIVVEPEALNVLLAGLGLAVWTLSERLGWTASMREWARRAGGSVLWTLWQPIHDGRVQYRWQQRGDHRNVLMVAMRNWLAPLLLTGVFVFLFRAANPVLGNWVDTAGAQLATAFENFHELLAPPRIVLWLVVGFVGWSLLRNRPTTQRHDAYTPPPPPRRVDRSMLVDRYITPGLVVRCLVLFNMLFALQTAMDVYYLWGGGELPEGMSYATYAHRGAYPLVATALLAGTFVLVTFRSGGPAERSVWARRLVYLWIGQNIFLMASAAWRLQLYVDVYSLTRWRFAAAVWMLLVALGLIWIIWRLVRHRDNAWLLRVNVVTVAAVLFACTLINIDGRIAWYNVQRCAEITGHGVPIDLDYLENLGIEALPAVAWLQRHVPRDVTRESAGPISRTQRRLERRLHQQLSDWRGWTWRRHQLAQQFPAE